MEIINEKIRTARKEYECNACIWLGANEIGMQEFKAGSGWVQRPEFDESSISHHFIANNRMHLTRQQVKKILPILQQFCETGEI